MHFIKKLMENPELENPPEDHMDVHRHFYRYSRGEFIGPAFQIWRTSTKLSLKGSFEYEDLIQEFVLKNSNKDEVKADVILITGKDISDKIKELGLDWDLSESTGKTKNFKAKETSVIERDKLIKAIEVIRKDGYLLLNFNLGSKCKVQTKKRIPQPSKKKPIDDDINSRIQFCKGYLDNDETTVQMALKEFVPDFKEDLPEDWSKISVTNNYKINEIEIPKKVKGTGNSRLLRIMAIRKGKLIRTADIDGDEVIEKQYSIVV
ncbi:MAG: hypothetical protein EU550_00515 [Promethearchaeota archaeon]|nr:MAG: hypothetical protein EU550_00515 [Candidatus Lokiarchaeota archaeon]